MLLRYQNRPPERSPEEVSLFFLFFFAISYIFPYYALFLKWWKPFSSLRLCFDPADNEGNYNILLLCSLIPELNLILIQQIFFSWFPYLKPLPPAVWADHWSRGRAASPQSKPSVTLQHCFSSNCRNACFFLSFIGFFCARAVWHGGSGF